METDGRAAETTVSDSGMVTVPAAVRRRLGIDSGDRLRWRVSDDGELQVEVVRERYGAFADATSAELGSDRLAIHDAAGSESETNE